MIAWWCSSNFRLPGALGGFKKLIHLRAYTIGVLESRIGGSILGSLRTLRGAWKRDCMLVFLPVLWLRGMGLEDGDLPNFRPPH